jgi:hypothetical protein
MYDTANRRPRPERPFNEHIERRQVMGKFGITEGDLRDTRVANLLKEKVSLDQEIRDLKKDENFFTADRVARGMANFGLTSADFKNHKVAELLKAILHARATIVGLRTPVNPLQNPNQGKEKL